MNLNTVQVLPRFETLLVDRPISHKCSPHYNFKQNIMYLSCVTCSFLQKLLVSLSNLGTMQYRHKQSEGELRHYKEVYEGKHLKYNFLYKGGSASS